MEKDSVIVVYIPDKGNFLEQFYGLYYSVAHKTKLHEKFDFLVCGPRSIEKSIPKKHCIFVELPEISKSKQFRYVYSGGSYGYSDSFAPFVDEECIDILLNYKYCLRLDVDTFLCEGILDLKLGQKDIVTGTAAYSSETARKKLPVIMSNLGLPDQDIANIGSTWFSTTENMIRQGARTLDFVSYFLKNEFEKHEGKWPQWYAGVILLYAGHVAINSSQLNIRKTDKFDYYSTSDHEVSDYYTIHCWHTEKFFSKFAFAGGKYKDREPISDSLRCDEYSFDCAINGQKMLYENR